MKEPQSSHGFSCGSSNFILGLWQFCLRERCFQQGDPLSQVVLGFFLCPFLSPARLRAFLALPSYFFGQNLLFLLNQVSQCLARQGSLPILRRSVSWSVPSSRQCSSPSESVSIRWEKSGGGVHAGWACLGKSIWGSCVQIWLWSNFLCDLGFGFVTWGGR